MPVETVDAEGERRKVEAAKRARAQRAFEDFVGTLGALGFDVVCAGQWRLPGTPGRWRLEVELRQGWECGPLVDRRS